MSAHSSWPSVVTLCFFLLLFPVRGSTDGPDVSALNVMYNSLNSPSQLTGWASHGGDPCGQGWKGIKCLDSSVTEIRLSGLGLTGSMGYQLSSLTSITYFDLSNNNIHGDIPYQLPPNAVHINLHGNTFTGGVPYSISQMTDLKYLDLASNQLSGQLADMFGKLPNLAVLDLSYNHLTGNLPQSFGSLSSLNTLRLQNNQFTGSINVLATLPLEELNVQNNQFTGWVPNELKDINDLQTEGNSWSSAPAPPESNGSKRSSKGGKEKKWDASGGAIAGILIVVLVIALVLLVLVRRRSSAYYIDEENLGQARPFTHLASDDFKVHMMDLNESASLSLKPPCSDRLKTFNNDELPSEFHTTAKICMDPIDTAIYSLMDLQMATGSFNHHRILGNSSTGRTYKAKYADGKTLAVKKMDSSDLRSNDSDTFKKLVSNISGLRHPNITELVGYCSESGHHLLVYDYYRNGSLHEFLHLSDEYSKPLTWDTRVRIALGIAQAVEYLHEFCSPPVMHKNIKSANILLDAELNPHLDDCGLAVLYMETNKNLGPGYNAPECTSPSTYTMKSDVYSFGVVMLELLTGRMPFDSKKPRSEQSLVHWATPQLHDIDALDKMADPALRGLYSTKSLSRFADVIVLCVQVEPEFRPSMSEVVQSLSRCSQRPRGGL